MPLCQRQGEIEREKRRKLRYLGSWSTSHTPPAPPNPDEAHFFGKKEALLDQINQFASTREEKDHFPVSQKTVLYLSPLLTGPSFPGTEYYNILSLHKQIVFLLEQWIKKVIFGHFGIKGWKTLIKVVRFPRKVASKGLLEIWIYCSKNNSKNNIKIWFLSFLEMIIEML